VVCPLIVARVFRGNGLGDLRAIKKFGLKRLINGEHYESNHEERAQEKKPGFHCLETTKKRTAFSLAMKTSMEDKALEILRIMLGRRGLDTKTERVTLESDRANVYTIGAILTIFSQKDKLQDRDLTKMLDFADANGYTNGIILVGMSPASENLLKAIKSHAKDRLQFFHIRQLQFDITTHRMAMPHRILNEEERAAIFKTYKISKPEEQLPWIDSQDAMVKWTGALPGDILEVARHSDVAGVQYYYRFCVPDVNVA
jgi:DNA-directed RNA polymerase subunit H (RpoH/RPB5)